MSSFIIGFMVFAAFARAAREYNKSALAWGAIGLASFFIPQYLIAFLGTAILLSAGAPGVSLLLLVADFVASAVIATWACNKLMERAIRELESLDAAASATVAPNLDRH